MNEQADVTSASEEASQQYKRQFVRVDIGVPATYETPDSSALITSEIKDIGGGGLRLSTTEDMPLGQKVQLRFSLPSSSRVIFVFGRSVLSFYEAKSQTFIHGIAFTQISGRDRDEIVDYVAENLRKQIYAIEN